MELKTAIEILEYHQEWRLGKRECMIHKPKKLTEAMDIVLREVKKNHLGAVSFRVFDTVYMDSPFGRYTGIVKDVKGGKMTIESHSPTGKGMMLADYDVEGTEWKKY